MNEYLFNAPWWLPTALALAGIALVLTGYRRQEGRLKVAGLVALVVGAVIATLSYFVQTPIEKALDRTERLVQAAEDRDWETFKDLLHPQTSFASYRNRDQLVAAARKGVESIGLKVINVTSAEARQTETVITVDLSLMSTHEVFGLSKPARTNWRFEWQRRGDEWLLYRIEPLPGGDVAPDSIEQHLPNVGRLGSERRARRHAAPSPLTPG